jgi:DNA-binding IscR family transcriptional regulator
VNEGDPVTSEALAYSINTSAGVVRSLLSRLSEAGLTTSQLGVGGGALLAKPAGKIRLLDVYLAVEDRELFATHRTPPCASCSVGANVLKVLNPTLTRAMNALEAELAAVTIADVARGVRRADRTA